MSSMPRRACVAVAMIAPLPLPGCSPAVAPARSATVYFLLDAPLCSSIVPVFFAMDGYAVGADTFRVNLPNPHVKSAAFTTSAGYHVLSANSPPVPGLRKSTTVNLEAGTVFADTLPLYCS